MPTLDGLIALVDSCVACVLVPVAIWILISGLDDLLLDSFWLARALSRVLDPGSSDSPPSRTQLEAVPEKLIAIFTPLWREDRVIGRMVQRNIAALRYSNYCFFLGAYPNDDPTLDALRELEDTYPNVHLALCPHPGPTSKADCLNWIYQRLLEYEREMGRRFDVIVVHDAEDVIHPESLRWTNYYSEKYEMVQIPVLPLPTALDEPTHGLYCDEFSEFQFRDMPCRHFMGSFVPSNGVGTGFSRKALDRLAALESNRIFEPVCLTEDYENGIRLHYMNASQIFVPLRHHGPITREYFPQDFKAAIRQRTRWLTGIALQSWERHGWRGGWAVRYWFWRDRKNLIGAPVSLLANLISVYGLAMWSFSEATGGNWLLRSSIPAIVQPWLKVTAVLAASQITARVFCSSRFYGWKFAVGVPIRAAYGNLINSAAAFCAVWRFTRAKLRNEPLVWLKTDHEFPSQAALHPQRRRLGKLLVDSGFIASHELESALALSADGRRIGERLMDHGVLTEAGLYEALQVQTGLPLVRLSETRVRRSIARALPAALLRERRLLPFKVESGSLFIATPEVPDAELRDVVAKFTRLNVRFHLITPANYTEVFAALVDR